MAILIGTIVLVLIGAGFITRWLVVSARADKRVMSPTMKTLTVAFGGMAVMVVTVVGGVWIALALPLDHGNYMFVPHMFFGAVIGLVVGVTIWAWLGYMVCREKKPAPNEVIPDDSTT
jgi:Na+/H+-translocating membrane pyrophosphatase